ncbi:MAG: ribonuclease H [Actinobacteria bacterium]|nr:ribonuclease H [Actinomycetota bacterium]|tara:strand:+ start:338 stop:727 length:390 start_codon:yes stop_codon:yes gene_type:complete
MYEIYCDGASRSNPGEASIGVSIIKESKEIESIAQKIGIATNNVAEYESLKAALIYCVENNVEEVSIFLDSLLVVQQVNEKFKVKSDNLKELYKQCKDLMNKINNLEIHHVRRELNKRADELANIALDS